MDTATGRRNLLSYLDELPAHGRRPLYLWRDGVRWRRRSYEAVHARSLACAERLAAAGVASGHTVLLQGPETADWVEALHGILRLGGVPVPLSPDTPESFRHKVADKVAARLLIAPSSIDPPPGIGHLELGSWPHAPGQAPPRAEPEPDRTAEIVFTSGATGEPRGVVLTHGNLISDLAPIEKGFRRRRITLRAMGTVPVLTTVPLSHMFGQVLAAFLMPIMGLTVVITPPHPREVIGAARRHGAYGMIAVPRVLELLAAELSRRIRHDWDPESLRRRRENLEGRPFWLQSLAFLGVQRHLGWRFRFLISGGAALPADILDFYEGFGYLVTQGYGLTETAPVISLSNPFRRGSSAVGKPLSGQEVKIGPGGEIWVRGGNVSPGYLGEEAREAEGGWFRTGDLGTIDALGQLHIKGRVKDVIVTAEGENVHTSDVEAALMAIDGVREAGVIGLPGKGGDQVHAVLVLADGVAGDDVVREANGRLAARQRIRGHTLWPEDALPRTGTGKVRKGALISAVTAMREGVSHREALAAEGGGLRSVLARLARVEPDRIRDDTKLQADLGLNSLDLVELIAAAEDELGIALPEEGIEAASFGDLKRMAHQAEGVAMIPGRADSGKPDGGRGGPGMEALDVTTEHDAWRRGRLSMPRWAFTLPVRLLRRGLEEAVFLPVVALFTRTEVTGRENLDDLRAPFLVVANHRSHLDTALVKRFLPRRLRGRLAPGMTTRHHRGAFGEATGSYGRYFVERLQVFLVQLLFQAWPLPETVGFRRSLDYAGELADRGFIPLVFPEGRHVPEGEMHPFRGGIGLFVRDLRCDVLPVYLEGTADVLPSRAWWFRFGRTRLVFGQPFRVDPGIAAADATRRAEEAVRSLRPDATTGPGGGSDLSKGEDP